MLVQHQNYLQLARAAVAAGAAAISLQSPPSIPYC
jgi:hypothetical protein